MPPRLRPSIRAPPRPRLARRAGGPGSRAPAPCAPPSPPRPPARPPRARLSLPNPRPSFPGRPGARGEGAEPGRGRRGEAPRVSWGPTCPPPTRGGGARGRGARGVGSARRPRPGGRAPHDLLHMKRSPGVLLARSARPASEKARTQGQGRVEGSRGAWGGQLEPAPSPQPLAPSCSHSPPPLKGGPLGGSADTIRWGTPQDRGLGRPPLSTRCRRGN